MESKQAYAWKIAVKHELSGYIRQISNLYGGDDGVFLSNYIADVLDLWKDDLVKARNCFLDILKTAKEIRPHGKGKPMGQAGKEVAR